MAENSANPPQELRAHATFTQRGDLVLHQRDQRRHHHASAGPHQRRDLIAQGLASTRGHEHQGVAAVDHVGNDVGLGTPEGLKTKNRL